jgi:methionine synthase II (cobalamin-independent)
MKRSTDRILTTHAGSLPRPADLLELVQARAEHPELIAERIERFASVVGRENVIAGSDCGFATFAGSLEIHPSIAWAKLGALAEGARIASARLWS